MYAKTVTIITIGTSNSRQALITFEAASLPLFTKVWVYILTSDKVMALINADESVPTKPKATKYADVSTLVPK